MLYLVKDAKNIDKNLFPKPDYSFIGKGDVKVSDPIWIPFNQLFVPEDGQRGRVETQPLSDRITRIKNSFAPGIRTTEFLPAVIKRDVDSSEPLQYELLYGVGRTWAFEHDMGADGYWYNVIDTNETNLEWVCLCENEDLEKTSNKENDVVVSVIRLVKKSAIKSNQKSIDAAIRHNLPFRRTESRNRIVAQVCLGAGVLMNHVTYTEGTALKWITENSSVDYVIGGNWDPIKSMYGHLVKEGRVQHFFHNAIMHKAATDKSSYALMHYDLPSEKSSFADKNQKQFDTVEAYHEAYTKLGMDTRSFIFIKGAIPQDRSIHNWKVLVKFPTKSLLAKVLKLAA